MSLGSALFLVVMSFVTAAISGVFGMALRSPFRILACAN